MGYEISVEGDYVLLRVEPDTHVDRELLMEMLAEVHANHAYQTEKKAGVWDFRKTRPEMGFYDMLRIKKYVRENYDPSWTHHYTALVVDNEAGFGFARMYETITDDVPTEVSVFRDFDAAVAWVREKTA